MGEDRAARESSPSASTERSWTSPGQLVWTRHHSQSAIAPADEPASAAPARQAAAMAFQTALARSTSTTQPGSPPAMYTRPASAASATTSGERASALDADPQLADSRPSPCEPATRGVDRSGREVLRSGRDDIGRPTGARVAKNFVLVLVAGVELVAADEGEGAVHMDTVSAVLPKRGASRVLPPTL